MSRLGPVITLAAGAVLAAGLGVASILAAPVADEATTVAAATPTAEATSGATQSPATQAPVTTQSPVEQTPARANYATRIKGGLLAISVRNGKAIAYFCDGRTEAWFKGKAAEGAIDLKGFGEATLTADLGGGKAEGSLKLAGKDWDFTASSVKKPSGLYRATALVRGAQIKAGWIMLQKPDGNGFYQVGLAVKDEKPTTAPTLDTAQPTAPVQLGDATLYPEEIEEIS